MATTFQPGIGREGRYVPPPDLSSQRNLETRAGVAEDKLLKDAVMTVGMMELSGADFDRYANEQAKGFVDRNRNTEFFDAAINGIKDMMGNPKLSPKQIEFLQKVLTRSLVHFKSN